LHFIHVFLPHYCHLRNLCTKNIIQNNSTFNIEYSRSRLYSMNTPVKKYLCVNYHYIYKTINSVWFQLTITAIVVYAVYDYQLYLSITCSKNPVTPPPYEYSWFTQQGASHSQLVKLKKMTPMHKLSSSSLLKSLFRFWVWFFI